MKFPGIFKVRNFPCELTGMWKYKGFDGNELEIYSRLAYLGREKEKSPLQLLNVQWKFSGKEHSFMNMCE